MSFKTQAEIFTALLENHTIKNDDGDIVKLIDGEIHSLKKSGYWTSDCFLFDNPSGWLLHEEPKKITLYRYTYEAYGMYHQSEWISKNVFDKYQGSKILKTETKEVEI